MATVLPQSSPPPRRSARPSQAVNSPFRRAKHPPGARTASRLATPARESVQPSEFDPSQRMSVFSDREFPRSGSEIFSKSEQLTVTFYGGLPVEVRQILRNASFDNESFGGGVDTETGFCLISSATSCFVWQHAQAIKTLPTCFIFPSPPDPIHNHPPFHSFIPYGGSREPGLLLVSSSGEIRFWDSISVGLSGGEYYDASRLDLSTNEAVTTLNRLDPTSFITSTSLGQLHRISLTSVGGKQHMTIRVISRPTPAFGLTNLFPSLLGGLTGMGPDTFSSGHVNSIAFGSKSDTGGTEIFALVASRIQRWRIRPEGWEELVDETAIEDTTRAALSRSYGSALVQSDAILDLEFLDLAVDEEGLLVVLVSHAAHGDKMSMSIDMSGVRRLYHVAFLSVAGPKVVIKAIRPVPHQSTLSSLAPVHPRIQLVPGRFVSVQFGDAVAIIKMDADYRDRLELRATSNRTFGVGVIPSTSTLLILTVTALIKVEIDVENVSLYDPETGHASLMKSIMIQAILYGPIPDNPLNFSFPPEVDEESVMQAAEQLSDAVLQSDPEIVKPSHDLSSQLFSRQERLRWLIEFINDNGALTKMSQRSRQKLATNAEKMYTGHQLWLLYNDLLTSDSTHRNILQLAVDLIRGNESEVYNDPMRIFFSTRINELGLLLQSAIEVAQTSPSSDEMLQPISETNRVVNTVINRALEFREHSARLYGLDPPMIDSWTCNKALIESLFTLVDLNMNFLGIRNEAMEDAQEYEQIPQVVSVLMACVRERLDWLKSGVGVNPSQQHEFSELSQRYDLWRPDVMSTLWRNGYSDAAFDLSERDRDFYTLAILSHLDVRYPPESNPHGPRIHRYIETYKENFTYELFNWYIQNNELRLMFSEGLHGDYLSRFFSESPKHSGIAWIHDLSQGRYKDAAMSLHDVSSHVTNLSSRQSIASIGKLACLAHLSDIEYGAEDETLLDSFHDELDFVSVHHSLLKQCHTHLESMKGRQSREARVDAVIKHVAVELRSRPFFATVLKGVVSDLLDGKMLSVEDTVDALTLKDNSDSAEDYATALCLIDRAQNVPQSRIVAAYRTVWRRIYIHDDWQKVRSTADVTDVELMERLRTTALYTTLRSLTSRGRQDMLQVSPDEALMIPTDTDISARWSGLSADEKESAIHDFNVERDTLGELDSLEDVYPRIRELAMEDGVWDSE